MSTYDYIDETGYRLDVQGDEDEGYVQVQVGDRMHLLPPDGGHRMSAAWTIPDEDPVTCEGCGLRSYETCTWDDGVCDDCQGVPDGAEIQ